MCLTLQVKMLAAAVVSKQYFVIIVCCLEANHAIDVCGSRCPEGFINAASPYAIHLRVAATRC